MYFFIDDNWLALTSWIRMLERAGKQTARNNDARRSIQFLEENKEHICCVILDVMMPAAPEWIENADRGKGTGLIVADNLRGISDKLPIIFLTNHRDSAVIAELKRYPYSRYLDKRDVRPTNFAETVLSLHNEIKADIKNDEAQKKNAH